MTTDELVREYLRGSHSIAYDGCCTIYINSTERATNISLAENYGSVLLLSDLSMDEALATVRGWFERSCRFRSIESMPDYEKVIAQGQLCDWDTDTVGV